MNITNGLDTITLQNVGVTVNFTDEQGNPVVASSDPNNTSAQFFIRIDSMAGIAAIDGTGTVQPSSSADIHWLIIPAKGAAGGTPVPKLYYVGAFLSYTLGGEPKTVDVKPDLIYVEPTPILTLDYFLPIDVFADDPFTLTIEPPIPFNLGVRVSNNGYGVANNLKIDSAQPKIVENVQGLLINFELLGSSVNDAPVAPSLLLDFGTIDSYAASVGRWQMQTSLSGKFTEFTSSFSHADSLGGQLTSLIDGTFTHFLLHDVVVDLPGRDGVRDFLATDASILPANGGVVRVYESEGGDTAVTNQTTSANLVASSSGAYILTMPPTAGLSYVHLPDPFHGTKVLSSVVRSDGKAMPLENVWLSKKRNNANGWDYFFNLFDTNSTGSYGLTFADPAAVDLPPVIAFIPDYSILPGNQLGFLVNASASNGSIPVLSTGQLPIGASFVDNGDGTGSFIWTPVAGQEGEYPLTIKASDGTLNASQNILITVGVINAAPVAVNDLVTTNEDTVVSGNVLTNDTDADGDPITARLNSLPSNGDVSLAVDGSFTYTPNFNFAGSDSFSYIANDGTLDSTVAVVNITINAINDAPVVGIQVEGYALQFDGINDVATIPSAMIAAQSSVTIEAWFNTTASGGLIGYSTPIDAYGSVQSQPLMYVGTDGLLYAAFAPDTQPIASNSAVNDGVWHHVAFVGDSIGSSLYIDGVLAGRHSVGVSHAGFTVSQLGLVDSYGWVAGSTNNSSYFNGTIDEVRVWNTKRTAAAIQADMRKALTGAEAGLVALWPLNDGSTNNALDTTQNGNYLILGDGTLNSQPSWVVSTAPIYTDVFSLTEDTYTSVKVLASDAEGAPLIITVSILPNSGMLYQTSDGVVPTAPILSAGAIISDPSNRLVFIPAANGSGLPYDSFSIDVSDGVNVTTLPVTVNVTPVNDAPVANAGALVTDEDVTGSTAITVTDPDIGDTHTYAITTASANGSATVSASGVVSYTPNLNYNGSDSLTVTVTDSAGASTTVVIPVTVNAVNDAPTSATASITTDEDVSSIGVSPTVVDIDDTSHTFTIVTQASNGVASVVNNQLVYAPSLNFNGTDSFTFKASDAGGLSVVGTASVTINAVNDAPVSVGDHYVTDEDVALTGSTVLVNDSDIDGDPLSAVLVSTTVNGTLTLNVDGTFSYTPNANWNGVDTFSYTANDGQLDSNVSTVSITVNAVNDVPVANAGVDQYAFVGDVVMFNGMLSSDIDGDSLTYSWRIASAPTTSLAMLSSATSVMTWFMPDEQGDYTFELVVNDGQVNSIADQVSLHVPNRAPVAILITDPYAYVDDSVVLDGYSSYDLDHDSLTYYWSLVSPNGSASQLSDPYASAPTFTVDHKGIYTATLIVHDGIENSLPVSRTIVIPNRAPVADAGLDQTVYICDLATVDGYSSYDLDHDPITYAWSLSSPQGSSSVLTSTNNSNTSFVPDVTGQYLAQLVVHDGTVQSTADVAILNAINPPVNVVTNTHFGSASRMLVLLPKIEHDGDAAPLNYMYLESTLQTKGWLYTLVSDEESFVEEMHTGGYSTYAIFANQVAHKTARELQAAVYRGEGLLLAVAEELGELSKVLGAETKGSTEVWQLDIVQSQVSGATTIRFVDKTKVQAVELNGATSFATAAMEDDGVISYAPIAVVNAYGQGQTVYLGFDMLTEVGTGIHNGVLADILNESLEYIKPASTLALAGAVVPIVMDIENTTCVPTLGNIIVNVPQGFEVVDDGGAYVQADGSLLWSFNMQGNTKEQTTFWVRLPVTPTAYSISGSLEAGYSSSTIAPLNTLVFEIDLLQSSIDSLFSSALDIPMNNNLEENLSNVHEMWLDYEYHDLQNVLLGDEYLFLDSNMPQDINLLFSRVLRYTHLVEINSSSSD